MQMVTVAMEKEKQKIVKYLGGSILIKGVFRESLNNSLTYEKRQK